MHRSEEVEIVEVAEGALLDDTRALVQAYGRWVASHPGYQEALEAQGFEAEVAGLPGDYTPPAGCLILALVNGLAAGCVALRTIEPGVGEIKRLFVAPGYRGMSLGRRLLDSLVDRASSMQLRVLRLDTLPFMHNAVRQYRHMGFVERDPYGAVPLPGARYFELVLPPYRPAAELVRFHPDHVAPFEQLNRGWLEEYFHVEEKDERVFRDPHGTIVAPGGEIFFIREGERIVGTCAVACHGPGEFELAKMAVDRDARGQGYGEWLVREAIAFARARSATRLFLLSDEVLIDALRLYERMGFVRAPFPGATGYRRGDVMMEYPLAGGHAPAAPPRPPERSTGR